MNKSESKVKMDRGFQTLKNQLRSIHTDAEIGDIEQMTEDYFWMTRAYTQVMLPASRDGKPYDKWEKRGMEWDQRINL